MKVRSRAPLRLGIAGGGTDVSTYSNEHGGNVLNATINLYSHCFLDDEVENNVIFESIDLGIKEIIPLREISDYQSELILHKAVYLRIMKDFNSDKFIPLKITTFSDAPPGSGLGSSSTLVVAMIEALRQYFILPLGEYDIANLAYEIERKDCGLLGGKQDQYAATFGGFNFIEFGKNDSVIVNPLRIRRFIKNEIESSLILFFSGISRDSSKIIRDQIESISNDAKLNAMHQIKESAVKIKDFIFKGDIEKLTLEFNKAWESKKATSKSISNDRIKQLEEIMNYDGVNAFKVSGAGGGGFVMIIVDPEKKYNVINELKKYDGFCQNFQFVDEGCISWNI